jgi:hypothetical protein
MPMSNVVREDDLVAVADPRTGAYIVVMHSSYAESLLAELAQLPGFVNVEDYAREQGIEALIKGELGSINFGHELILDECRDLELPRRTRRGMPAKHARQRPWER